MKCKQAEKLIIELSQTEPNPKVKAELEAHLFDCSKCGNFARDVQMVQQGIKQIKAARPSIELLERTGALCQSELLRQSQAIEFKRLYQSPARIPSLIWIALIAFSILIIVWSFPILKEFITNQIITHLTIYVIAIIIQNILMILFSPVLFGSMRLKFRLMI